MAPSVESRGKLIESIPYPMIQRTDISEVNYIGINNIKIQ